MSGPRPATAVWKNALEAAMKAGVRRFVYTGSVATIARPQDGLDGGRQEEGVGHVRFRCLSIRTSMPPPGAVIRFQPSTVDRP